MNKTATFLAVLLAAPLPLVGCDDWERVLELSSCETSKPGPTCPKKETCPGQCVPIPPGGWDLLPMLLWFGPELEAPECPADRAGAQAYEGFADPLDPPECPSCSCEPPTGECELPLVLTASDAV